MQLSDAGLSLIKTSEGFSGRTYPDSNGKQAIGYGHNLHPGESFPNGITEIVGTNLLLDDVEFAVHAVSTLVKVPIQQNQFDALVDFTYNEGTSRLAGTTMLTDLNAGHYTQAALDLVQWCHEGKTPVRGLLTRRLKEASLFLTNCPHDKA